MNTKLIHLINSETANRVMTDRLSNGGSLSRNAVTILSENKFEYYLIVPDKFSELVDSIDYDMSILSSKYHATVKCIRQEFSNFACRMLSGDAAFYAEDAIGSNLGKPNHDTDRSKYCDGRIEYSEGTIYYVSTKNQPKIEYCMSMTEDLYHSLYIIYCPRENRYDTILPMNIRNLRLIATSVCDGETYMIAIANHVMSSEAMPELWLQEADSQRET